MVESAAETRDASNVSTLATSGAEEMAEAMPNGRSEVVPQVPRVVTLSSLPNGLLGIFGDQLQEPLKTTHIVIHDQSVVKSAPLAPQTPTTTPALSALVLPSPNVTSRCPPAPASAGRKLTWDSSVLDPVLPVRCRNIRGELHKNRFGSGSRGKCIAVGGGGWFTPSEFEAACGRGNSKDWKRSIRYAGRTLQCVIEEGFLQPHATSCTCATCCSDSSSTMVAESSESATPTTATSGPVRLFTPYKRRKRLEKQKPSQDQIPAGSENTNTEVVVSLAPVDMLPVTDIQVSVAGINPVEAAPVPGITHNIGNACPESVIVTPAATPQTPRNAPTALDFAEQRQWWQLEEMVKNVVRQSQELQKQVETAKAQSTAAKEAAVQQLRTQMENEKKEVLNACRVEAQMNLSRAILEAKTEKELAVEQALQQARMEMQDKLDAMVADKGDPHKRCANCDREAFSECTGCRRVSYCSTFCQRKDWQNHQDECGEAALASDCIDELSEQPIE